MANILLSIKTEYVSKILSGEKTFEYRKRIPKQAVDKIVIYETSPKKKIVGVVEVKGVVSDTPIHLWEGTSKNGGISKKDYLKYFAESKEAYAFALGNIIAIKQNCELSQLGINQPPQSYCYLNDNQMKKLMKNC